MKHISFRDFFIFVFKFLLLFAVFYFGTLFFIGLASPGGLYSPFVSKYFDYVSWLKFSYMKGASLIAAIFGYSTLEESGFLLRVVNARGVIIAYDCVGYGVMSFWAAFTIANKTNIKSKIKWLLGGLLLLWLINTIRIGLFLVAINKNWPMPLGLNHHTLFNIFAYSAIFFLIYFFDKTVNKKINN